MMRQRRALIVGFDYYGRFLAKLVNEHSSTWTLQYRGSTRLQTLFAIIDACSVDAIVSFGGPGPDAALADLARRRNIPVIVIWAGTDVTYRTEGPASPRGHQELSLYEHQRRALAGRRVT